MGILHSFAAEGAADKIARQIKYKNGASELRTTDEYGFMPIHHAAANGCIETIKVLLEAGSPVDGRTRGGDEERTPLMLAAIKGNLAAAKHLVAAGANVNAEDEDTMTPLAFACHSKQKEIAEFLLQSGAQKTDHWGVVDWLTQVGL